MDPNETLRRLLDLVNDSLTDGTASPRESEIVELIWSINSWITMGGFLPKQWDHPHRMRLPKD